MMCAADGSRWTLQLGRPAASSNVPMSAESMGSGCCHLASLPAREVRLRYWQAFILYKDSRAA